MARQIIDTSPPSGDPAPTAFNKVNAMTAELYPLATGALQKDGGGAMTGTLNSSANLGLAVGAAGFAAVSLFATGPGGRDYRIVSTDNDNGLGGGQLITYNQTAGVMASRIDTGYNQLPGADNSRTLGSASARWSVVYAGTGSINTSDARQKTEVLPLDTAEIEAAIALGKEVGTFRFLDAINAKGDSARLHVGMTVQRAIELMEAHGLDATKYAFICHDTWSARQELKDDQGVVMDPGCSAGDLYSFRTDQLLLFIASGFEARLRRLEDESA